MDELARHVLAVTGALAVLLAKIPFWDRWRQCGVGRDDFIINPPTLRLKPENWIWW